MVGLCGDVETDTSAAATVQSPPTLGLRTRQGTGVASAFEPADQTTSPTLR